MAFINFGFGTQAVRMTDEDLVDFDSLVASTSKTYAWSTPDRDVVSLFGSNFLRGADARPAAGTATSAQIDIGGEGLNDVQITGLNLEAKTLDNGSVAFWEAVLAGTTVIEAQALSATTGGSSFLFGDDLESAIKAGSDDGSVTDSGGNDVFTLGAAEITAFGDMASTVSSGAGTFSRYKGGNDQLLAQATDLQHKLFGDADSVESRGTLIGGNDLIRIRSTAAGSEAVGDAGLINGNVSAAAAFLVGGDDEIEAIGQFNGTLVGDVSDVFGNSEVTGGADTISGGASGESIAGDVGLVRGSGNPKITGGDDTISANAGNDRIAGDVLFSAQVGSLIGGDDTVRGGAGNDIIAGEFSPDLIVIGPGGSTLALSGGNDKLFGELGDDLMFGQTGIDLVDGGAGADELRGGNGNDVLRGGAGKDKMFGQAGADTFDFNFITESPVGAAGRDVIRGWQSIDRLDLIGLDGNRDQAGNQNFTFAGEGAPNNNVAQGQVKFFQSGGNTFVVLNQTADNTADFQIFIEGVHDLTKGDFLGLI